MPSRLRARALSFLMLVAVGASMVGCGASNVRTNASAVAIAAEAGRPVDRDEVEGWGGEVILEIDGDATKEGTRVLDDGAFERVVDAINENLYLPEDITVRVTDDAEVVDSEYDYSNGVVSFPWEDFAENRALLEADGYDGTDLDQVAIAADQYFLAREIGHAVADQLSLPTLGRLEDAVDGFGSYVGTNLLEDTELAAAAAGVYASYADQAEADDYDFSQGHSVDEQRYFTTVCQAYGAEANAKENPYEALLEESDMPAERAEGCADEWDAMDISWETLLAPYLAEVTTERTYAVPTDEEIDEWDGEFVLKYVTDDSPEAEAVKDGGELEEVVEGLNDNIALPVDVKIRVGDPESEEMGPYFDGDRTIYLPWGYVELTRDALKDFGYKGEELEAGVRDSAAGTLLHEAGHALSALLQLPVVGREEDSADSFEIYAALSLLDEPEFGIADADVMGEWSNEANVDRDTYVDVHAVDAQRYYQAYCQVYGSDPEEFEYLAEGDTFDEDRLAECPDEWDAVEHSWDTVLAPFAKE